MRTLLVRAVWAYAAVAVAVGTSLVLVAVAVRGWDRGLRDLRGHRDHRVTAPRARGGHGMIVTRAVAQEAWRRTTPVAPLRAPRRRTPEHPSRPPPRPGRRSPCCWPPWPRRCSAAGALWSSSPSSSSSARACASAWRPAATAQRSWAGRVPAPGRGAARQLGLQLATVLLLIDRLGHRGARAGTAVRRRLQPPGAGAVAAPEPAVVPPRRASGPLRRGLFSFKFNYITYFFL
jgi:hypothetical protein